MSRNFDVYLPLERAYSREAMLAVELLDAVTLERITQGVEVTATGLTGKPIVNYGGLFVWLKEDTTNFQTLLVEPGPRPFERVEIPAAQVNRPLHTVELKPLANYPFSPGITAIRGSLIESVPAQGVAPVPIAKATIRLEWLDEDGATWKPSPATFVTDKDGDFTFILRLAPVQVPTLDTLGNMSIRLFAKRAAGAEKHQQFQLLQGRVTDATYAWDQLQ
ncbi:hypothetical protein [Bradyrhizobium sp. S3.2.12]|uniref:hypothetical protein n=1 Tax=Bradyrhizobium sp. S3.2.12 TaxID=3156387 RepID=UPI003390B981